MARFPANPARGAPKIRPQRPPASLPPTLTPRQIRSVAPAHGVATSRSHLDCRWTADTPGMASTKKNDYPEQTTNVTERGHAHRRLHTFCPNLGRGSVGGCSRWVAADKTPRPRQASGAGRQGLSRTPRPRGTTRAGSARLSPGRPDRGARRAGNRWGGRSADGRARAPRRNTPRPGHSPCRDCARRSSAQRSGRTARTGPQDAARTRTSFQERRTRLRLRFLNRGTWPRTGPMSSYHRIGRDRAYRGTASRPRMSSRHPRSLRARASS